MHLLNGEITKLIKNWFTWSIYSIILITFTLCAIYFEFSPLLDFLFGSYYGFYLIELLKFIQNFPKST